jgi:hypothetical protein
MAGNIHQYLADDHRRLDAFLDSATADPKEIDTAVYGQFRVALLTHIGMEEKVLLPAARKHRGGSPLPIAAKLRLDHGALTALLVPSPTAKVVATIKTILKLHNRLEEDPGGMYDQCEELLAAEADEILDQLQNFKEVRVLPHVNTPFVLESARRTLLIAGYDLEL